MMRTAVYRSPFIPAEWIEAYGFSPLRLIPDAETSDETILDTEGTCPFMRAFINDAASGNSDVIVLSTMCDQMRHAYDRLQSSAHKPVFLFNLPSTWQNEQSTALYISELHRLGSFLIAAEGSKPTDAHLADIMIRSNSERAIKASTTNTNDSGVPLALLGGAISRADEPVIRLISELDGNVVLDATESGERTMPALFDMDAINHSPVAELARAYFQTIPDAFRRPDSQLYDWLKDMIKERKPRGIIFLRQLWCDLWHAELEQVRNSFDLPLLDLDLNGQNSAPRNRTRIEAFMETLK